MQTLSDFIKSAGITHTAERANDNPNMASDTPMDHWGVTLLMGRSRLTVPFSMGKGHNGKKPDIKDVLDCLASDSASIENSTSFEEWASDLGYDTDSRRAFRIFNTCKKQQEKLKRFLGDSAYQTLLWETERE